jgi:hypothetical protein
MIEPLARGVDPVQLALQSLVNMGARTTRTESPLAVALERCGVDLARGEPLTTVEARQFVSLVRATLEVFETAVPVDQPTRRSGPLLETAQLAMRDLQRVVVQVLIEHQHITTSLAPILRQLLVAMQEVETAPPGPHIAVSARFEYPGAVPLPRSPVFVTELPPTLAGLVRSLVESMARLQAVLQPDALPRAEGQEVFEPEATAAVPRRLEPATVTPHVAALVPLPAETIRVLQILVKAVADLLTLLPQAAPPVAGHTASQAQPVLALAHALGESVVLLNEVLAGPAAYPSEVVTRVLPETDRPPAQGTSGQAAPPPSPVGLGGSVAVVVSLLHELLVPQPAAPPRPSMAIPAAAPAPAAELPLPLATSLAQVVARLTTAGLPPAVLQFAVDVSVPLVAGSVLAQLETAAADLPTPLVTATLLAQLEAAMRTGVVPTGIGLPLNSLETFDAYRWGLLVGLNYRTALSRPLQAPVSSARPRCEVCGRLLEQSRSGVLVCPTC